MRSDTYQGFAILRSNFESGSDADIAAAVAYGKRMKIYPLGGSADQTVYLDVYDKMFDATIPYDVRFFESLNRFVQAEPWLTRDKVMIDSLKAVGIANSKPFSPDAKTRSILDEAARVAGASIDKWYERAFSPPFFEGTHWALPVSKETIEGLSTMFADPDSYPIDGRAVYFSVHTSAPSTWAPASSTSWRSMTNPANPSTERRPTGCTSRRTRR